MLKHRSDHDKEFENILFSDFCEAYGITHEFLTPKIPQQNGVVERKNKTIQDMIQCDVECQEHCK